MHIVSLKKDLCFSHQPPVWYMKGTCNILLKCSHDNNQIVSVFFVNNLERLLGLNVQFQVKPSFFIEGKTFQCLYLAGTPLSRKDAGGLPLMKLLTH